MTTPDPFDALIEQLWADGEEDRRTIAEHREDAIRHTECEDCQEAMIEMENWLFRHYWRG